MLLPSFSFSLQGCGQMRFIGFQRRMNRAGLNPRRIDGERGNAKEKMRPERISRAETVDRSAREEGLVIDGLTVVEGRGPSRSLPGRSFTPQNRVKLHMRED
jgi:hypothetical protein